MVRMENIKREGNYVSFDGYMDGHLDEHFRMEVDLTGISKSECSIEPNWYTGMAARKILSLVVNSNHSGKELPSECTYIWY